MVIAWKTGAAATEWRYNHKLKTKYLKVVRKPQAASSKRQASSLTVTKGQYRINLERGIMRKINRNNLEYYFMEDHKDLPSEYLASCEKFFTKLARDPVKTKTSKLVLDRVKKRKAKGPLQNDKVQAASGKRQA